MGEAGTVAGDAPRTVYRLRVVLSGISPMIWRQLEVPATLSLAQLHEESGKNWGRLRGQLLVIGGLGEVGVPAPEVAGELVVEDSGTDLK